jgi:hypothetical protein
VPIFNKLFLKTRSGKVDMVYNFESGVFMPNRKHLYSEELWIQNDGSMREKEEAWFEHVCSYSRLQR